MRSENMELALQQYEGYRALSEAPSRTQLEDRARVNKIPLREVLEREREERYLALMPLGKGLGVYAVANPAAWQMQDIKLESVPNSRGVQRTDQFKALYRPAPSLLGELRQGSSYSPILDGLKRKMLPKYDL